MKFHSKQKQENQGGVGCGETQKQKKILIHDKQQN